MRLDALAGLAAMLNNLILTVARLAVTGLPPHHAKNARVGDPASRLSCRLLSLRSKPLQNKVNQGEFLRLRHAARRVVILPGNQQPKHIPLLCQLSYGYLSDRQDSNLQPSDYPK
jgi:hypothetical protein